MRVVLVARRRERLETLAEEIRAAGGSARILTADLRREADRVRLCEQAGNADVLVNNAGLGWYGYGDKMSWKTAQEMLQVNVEAVVQLSLAFLAGCASAMPVISSISVPSRAACPARALRFTEPPNPSWTISARPSTANWPARTSTSAWCGPGR